MTKLTDVEDKNENRMIAHAIGFKTQEEVDEIKATQMNGNLPKIRFGHHYNKMPPAVEKMENYIIGVSVCDIENLPQGFLAYDAFFVEGGETGMYPLPKSGKAMLITFFSWSTCLDIVWTTIRSWAPKKEDRYRSLIGKRVEIVIGEDDI